MPDSSVRCVVGNLFACQPGSDVIILTGPGHYVLLYSYIFEILVLFPSILPWKFLASFPLALRLCRIHRFGQAHLGRCIFLHLDPLPPYLAHRLFDYVAKSRKFAFFDFMGFTMCTGATRARLGPCIFAPVPDVYYHDDVFCMINFTPKLRFRA